MPGSDSPLATGSRRALVSIAVAVFGVSLAIHVGVAFGFEQLGVFGQLNVLFDSDPFRYGLIYGQGLGQPTFAHPLPRLFVQPMVAAVASVLQAATGLEAAAARSLVVSLVCPLASALNASLLFLLFCLLGVGRRHALLLTLVVDLSFASIVIGSIPESYAIASVALTGSFVLAALECSGRARALGPWWIVAGVLCLGITASNVVPIALI